MKWFRLFSSNPQPCSKFATSLFDETTFYNKFIQDLREAKQEVIIESPFITLRRLEMLKPLFEGLMIRGVKVFIMTRLPQEHDGYMSEQAEEGIQYFEELGVQVLLCTGGHHRKLAMIDRKVLWEGSLNILSQNQSREFMRRIDNEDLVLEMFEFLKLNSFIY